LFTHYEELFVRLFSISVITLALAACASNQPSNTAPAPAAAPAAKPVAAAPAAPQAPITGRFAALRIGMTMSEVTALIKAPDDMARHESGKRWIPFYFGSDIQKIRTYYNGDGCLIYSGGNQFGGGAGDLLEIIPDKTKSCF
jgi:hypothetical protein